MQNSYCDHSNFDSVNHTLTNYSTPNFFYLFKRIKELRRAKRAGEMSKEALDQAAETVKNAQQAVLTGEAAVVEITREETDMVVQSRLKTAEARHKEGKRVGQSNMNIIPYDSDGNKLAWKPKNMAFGMNK
jgi:hypothetical protein